MKKLLLFSALFLCFAAMAQQSKRALFIGNSYTYVNNLPQLVQDLALSKGDTFYHESSTPGGYSLQEHTTNATTQNKIKAGNWDCVILQDQSQRPSFPPADVANLTLPFAKQLVDSVKKYNHCATPMFYMTWGRKNGDASNCAFNPPVCTYSGMQNRLHDSYLLMSQQNNAAVSPVGAVWREMRANYPGVNLYDTDGSHPSINGSYLAACTFYASIFNHSPIGGWRPVGIDSTTAFNIQTLANNTVFDSLTTWRIDTLSPIPNFVWSQTNISPTRVYVEIDFSASQNVDSIIVDFDNGKTSRKLIDTTSYTANGTYKITAQLFHNCKRVVFTEDVFIIFWSIDEFNKLFTLYPNPAIEAIKLESKGIFSGPLTYTIYNIQGKKVKTGNLESTIIMLYGLKSGSYILEINGNKNSVRTQFQKID